MAGTKKNKVKGGPAQPSVTSPPSPESMPEAGGVPEARNAETRFRVLTERRPFWGGLARPRNALIQAAPDHPAIVAMLERAWIIEV